MIGIMDKWYSSGINSTEAAAVTSDIDHGAPPLADEITYDLRSAGVLTRIKGEHTSGLVFDEETLANER
jgi:hypothetical protein